MDIQKFKVVNDQFGVESGNRVLSYVHDRLLSCLEEGEYVARISADQFNLLLKAGTEEALEARIERMARVVNDGLAFDEGRTYLLTMTAGVCMVDDPALPLMQIRDRANVARKKVGEGAGGGRLCACRFYSSEDTNPTLNFTVTAEGDLAVTNTLYDHGGAAKGQTGADIKDSSQSFTMAVSALSAGHHQLVIEGKPKAGGAPLQQTLDLMLKDSAGGGDYQFTFPQGLTSYTDGTKVLQPKNGKVYQCKPFPYRGWCSQWSASATQYEPGIGTNWQDAWIALN